MIHEFFLLQINSNKEAFKDNFNKLEAKEEKRENIFVKNLLYCNTCCLGFLNFIEIKLCSDTLLFLWYIVQPFGS